MADTFDEAEKPFRYGNHIGPGPKAGPKRAVNVSVDADILAAAKAQNINFSQILEDALRKRTKVAREAKWADENRAYIDSYNAYVERSGVFGEEFQDWDDPAI